MHLALAMATLWTGPALGADHNEATGTKADSPGDIDDVYVWYTAGGKTVAIVTFSGPGGDPAVPPDPFDANMLYGIHIDNNGDNVEDVSVWVRFGQNASGAWGVQFEGIPGSTGTVSGAVGTVVDAGGGLRAQAGVFDDPFFFDLTGFNDTLATGTLAFDATRDSFAGKNVNAIVVEMDTATASAASNTFALWATSGRK